MQGIHIRIRIIVGAESIIVWRVTWSATPVVNTIVIITATVITVGPITMAIRTICDAGAGQIRIPLKFQKIIPPYLSAISDCFGHERKDSFLVDFESSTKFFGQLPIFNSYQTEIHEDKNRSPS